MKKSLASALFTIAMAALPVQAQTYTQIPFGVNKGVTPYNVGTLLNNVWYNFATLSAGGVFVINSTSGGAGTVSGVMAANGSGVVTGVSGTSGHTVPWLDGANTWSGTQTFSVAPVLPFTTGSIPFIGAGGVLSQDNGALYWDAANKRLGLGTATPKSAVQYKNANWTSAHITQDGAFYAEVTRAGGVGTYGLIKSILDITAPLPTGEIDVGITSWINETNLTGGSSYALWLGSNSPSMGRGDTWTGGQVNGGEINATNNWADFGLQNDKGLRSVTILQLVPSSSPSNIPLGYWAVSDITVASPAVVSVAGHNFTDGMGVRFDTSLGGTLPSPLVNMATYYVRAAAAGTFEISATLGGAAINTTGSFAGTVRVLPSYPASFGLLLSDSSWGHQIYTGIYVRENTIHAGGIGARLLGSNTTAAIPLSAIKIDYNWENGIDFSAATFSQTYAIKAAANQRLLLGTNSIFANDSDNLTLTTGTATFGRLLARNANDVAMEWGTSGSAPTLGFYGAARVTKPTVSDSRGGNAALASLLTQLANLGLITDSTTP